MPQPIDWEATVCKYHKLGLWHAVRHLIGFSVIREPYVAAQDVVQKSWEYMWKLGRFNVGLFLTRVMFYSFEAVDRAKPFEVANRPGRRTSPMTSTFPVQVFGCYVDEVTFLDDTRPPGCGDE